MILARLVKLARKRVRGKLKDGDMDLVEAIEYLRHFGYMAVNTADALDLAVAAFKEMVGQSPDSDITPDMIEAMRSNPRCGCVDNALMHSGGKWRKEQLVYRIVSYLGNISKSDQSDIFDLAFQQWEDHCGIKVRGIDSSRDNRADILIMGGSGRRDGFDGPGRTLAWAELAQGDDRQLTTKFDLAETWVKDRSQRGILLLAVSCHEFGHILGLDHSRVQQSLMAPFYSPLVSKPVQNDDVKRIQRLYGMPKPEVPPEDPPSEPSGTTTITIDGPVTGIRIPGYRVTKLI